MSFYTGKNVLVTGGAGICGQTAIRKLLDAGAYVRATTFTNRKICLTHSKLEVLQCDLMKMEDCDRVVKDMDIVINLVAFIKGAKGQTEDPMSLIRPNLYPSLNMMEAACREKVKIFGFVGSSTMYPDVPHPVKEEEAFFNDPSKVYFGVGWLKRYCEKVCMHYHNISKTKFAMIRTTAIYGPHDNFNPERAHVIPDLIMKVSKTPTSLEIWGDGTQQRDFVYVDDLVDGLLTTVEKHPIADPINISSGRGVSIKNLATLIVNEFECNPTFFFNVNKPTMNLVRLYNIEKAKTVLGWKPSTQIEDGIHKTVEWYKTHQM